MSLSADPERFFYENDRPNAFERQQAAERLAALEAATEALKEAGRVFGRTLLDIGMLECLDRRRRPVEPIEAIEDIADECASAIAECWTDEAKLEAVREVAHG